MTESTEILKIGEKFTFNEQEFICVREGSRVCGINSTNFYDSSSFERVYKIHFFVKNSLGYKIITRNRSITLVVEIFENCINFFNHFEFDEDKIKNYLELIENIYNDFNDKNQLHPKTSTYICK